MRNRMMRWNQVLALVCSCCSVQGEESLHFEVASVRSAPGGSWGAFSGGPGSNDPERITYGGTTLETLIRGAYNLEPYQVSGPPWLGTEFYAVSAKLPPHTTWPQYRQMMANLLAERFGLVFHRVKKDFRGYEIRVAKGGPRLTASRPNSEERSTFWGTSDGNGKMKYKATQTSMELLTNRVSLMMGARGPVVDRTGISGRFDFSLEVPMPSIRLSGSDLEDNAEDISSALQNQLGLKLNPVKISLEVLVIDHVERVPVSN